MWFRFFQGGSFHARYVFDLLKSVNEILYRLTGQLLMEKLQYIAVNNSVRDHKDRFIFGTNPDEMFPILWTSNLRQSTRPPLGRNPERIYRVCQAEGCNIKLLGYPQHRLLCNNCEAGITRRSSSL